jgi:iron-sulfur cluster insertion protein
LNTKILELTPAAIEATNGLRSNNEEYRNKDLRLYLAGKGCDGFEYGVSFDERESTDVIIAINDEISLLCDPRTLEFVRGSKIDWADDERGRGFLVENPNHRKFRGKFYKKSEWKTKILTELQSQ